MALGAFWVMLPRNSGAARHGRGSGGILVEQGQRNCVEGLGNGQDAALPGEVFDFTPFRPSEVQRPPPEAVFEVAPRARGFHGWGGDCPGSTHPVRSATFSSESCSDYGLPLSPFHWQQGVCERGLCGGAGALWPEAQGWCEEAQGPGCGGRRKFVELEGSAEGDRLMDSICFSPQSNKIPRSDLGVGVSWCGILMPKGLVSFRRGHGRGLPTCYGLRGCFACRLRE